MAVMRSKMRVLQLTLLVTLIFGSFSMMGLNPLEAAQRPVAQGQAAVSGPVNINKAGLEELQAIRGIGPALAERIVQFRKDNGPFETLEDLANVRGIGGAKLQKIKSQISV
ncbi:MAG: helix-hairpin-helix domain-containing protein [Candidatus Omnitrophica bacterium]|nr:helix-hairpin-helix domain-containing protein [Candidatus Omnitrophota bacterium]